MRKKDTALFVFSMMYLFFCFCMGTLDVQKAVLGYCLWTGLLIFVIVSLNVNGGWIDAEM